MNWLPEQQTAPITRESLERGFAKLEEDAEAHRQWAYENHLAWKALDLDWDAMTTEERTILQTTMGTAVVLHPYDHAKVMAMINKYRRDGREEREQEG